MRSIALFLMSIAAALALPASAQDAPSRVGRLAYVQGPVSVYQDPDAGWEKAYVNTPVTSENSVWADRGARAEVRIGGTAIRLDSETQLDFARLDENEIDANVERGTINVRVRYKHPRDRYSISTPQARFILETDGRYRVDVDPDNDESRLTVFAGDARMETSRGSVRVEPGRSVVVYGAYSQYVSENAQETRFDRWALARDGQWSDSVSRRYVPTDMTGYEDLDRYGTWAQEPDYGAIWYPRVTTSWAPYRHGHWSYVRPWGWTWIDDEPWGYAPSHYGRWVYAGNRWGWTPGRRVESSVWAPALVGWIGGSNWNVGVSSSPAVGWYPLAPWERYDPWYRANSNYTNQVNLVVQDRRPRDWQGSGGSDWRNWNRDRGVTVVQRDALINRRPVQGAQVQVPAEVIRNQQPVPPAQVAQVLPQQNELRRAPQPAAAAPMTVRPQPSVGGAPARPQQQQAAPAQPQQQQAAPAQNQVVRPQFARRPAPAPAPAPANQPPQQAAQPANPAARDSEAAQRARDAQQQQREAAQQGQQQQQQQRAREAQQQQDKAANDARAQREAQQRDAAQQQQRAREAQQQQEKAANDARAQREAQQRDAAQQQQRARDAQQQQDKAANDARAQREAQQREAQQQQQQQQRAREAQQQRDAQQVQQREAQQREAAQQQQRAREAQQQQEKAANDARAQREAQQRDAAQQQQRAREAQQQQQQQQQQLQQQQQREAQQAQQKAREAQQAQERAQRAPPPPPPPPQAQQPAQNPAARPAPAPDTRSRAEREKDKQDEEKKKAEGR